MKVHIAEVLGAFAIEFQRDLSVDRGRQRSRDDLLRQARASALMRQARSERAAALDGAAGSAAGAVASACSAAGEVTGSTLEGDFGEVAVSRREDLAKTTWSLKKAGSRLAEVGRTLGGPKADRAERARLEGSTAAAMERARQGLDRARDSIDHEEAVVELLLSRAKKG